MAIHKIDGVDGDANYPKKFVELYCSGAVTKGQWVSITDTTSPNGRGQTVAVAALGPANAEPIALVIGVAAETKTAAGNLRIQTAGYCEGVSVEAGVAFGDALVGPVADTSATGMADKLTAAIFGPVIAGALTATSSSTATVMIVDQGYF